MPKRLPAFLFAFTVACAVACQPPGAMDAGQAAAADDGLPGVDTNSLTRAERDVWAELVTEQLAPCSSISKNIADCVRENAQCSACKPAASLLAQQIRRGKTKKQAEKAFRVRFAEDQRVSVDLDGSPSKGPPNAPITIVEWADFECGFCGRAVPILEEAQKAYPNQIQLVFKHFPLDAHVHAAQLSKVAIAAGNQGKFWEAHAALFAGRGGLADEAAIRKLAAELKLDADRLLADMQAPATAERVARDRTQADKLGLKGTPFIIINSRRFDFEVFDLDEDLRNWLDLELQLAANAKKVP
ncbi:MAG TPA: DsbA family protein [Polyangiaceae bacterium]|nr:DsbA family protein [Polyangiaceae bacterium]